MILFVGTKKQARDSVEEWAEKLRDALRQPPLAGRAADQLQHDQEAHQAPARAARATRRRAAWTCCRPRSGCRWRPSCEKLEFNLGGVADMQRLPDAIVIIDLKTEEIGLREAARLDIPIIGLVDTNCDPGPRELRDPRQRRRDPLLRPGHRHPGRGDRGRRRASGARRRPAARPRRRSASARRKRSASAARPRRRRSRRPRRRRRPRPRPRRRPRPPPRPRRRPRPSPRPKRSPKPEGRGRARSPSRAEARSRRPAGEAGAEEPAEAGRAEAKPAEPEPADAGAKG